MASICVLLKVEFPNKSFQVEKMLRSFLRLYGTNLMLRGWSIAVFSIVFIPFRFHVTEALNSTHHGRFLS